MRLGDACDKIGSGATPFGGTQVYASKGVAFIRSQNVYNDGFSWSELAFISDAHADQLKGVTVEEGDVLLNITGDSVARCCQAPSEVVPARVSQHVAIIRPRPALLDAEYLRYFLIAPGMQQQLLSLAGAGGTRDALTKAMIEELELPDIAIEDQRAIAHVLGSLDDKIELNQRMNETLDAMAQAIFKSWFVDFDPIHAKAEDRQPVGMDAATASLFPDSFEKSALGEIPTGWRAGVLGEVAENPRRAISPADVPSGTPYIGLEHMPRKSIALADWGQVDGVTSGKSQFRRGELLFGKLRPYFHKVGVAAVDGVCSTDILVITPKVTDWFGFVLGHVSSEALVEHADATSTGTKMPRTNWKDLAAFRVAMPSPKAAATFTSLVRPMVDLIISNIHQSQTLTALRDTLIPELISGRVHASDIWKILEERP